MGAVAFRKKTLAIYTLTERAGERLKSLLETWFEGVKVVVSNDKVGNPSLRKMAEGEDIFLVCTGSAKHAATTFIQEHRPKEKATVLVSSNFSASNCASRAFNMPVVPLIERSHSANRLG